MASLYKQKNSPYYWVQLTPNEKKLLGRNNFSTKEKNKRKAELVLKKIKDKIAVAKIKEPLTPLAELSFLNIYERFKLDFKNTKGREYNHRTLDNYRIAINAFLEAAGNKPIGSYNRNDFHQFVELMDNKGWSQNTKAIYTKQIYAIFNWAKKEGYIHRNIMKRVAEEVKPIRAITDEEMKRFLEYAKTTKFYNLVQFMLLSAFRAQEALSVKWTDYKNGFIKIKGKGNKTVYFPVCEQLKELLSSLKRADERIFPYAYKNIHDFFTRASNKLGFQIKSHDLRKYRISQLANSGVDIIYVKEFARHEDIKTTLRYYTSVNAKKMIKTIDEKGHLDLL